ncbi:MAG TPA: hypothetical protein DC042_09810 [Bacteroidales bacterium]|nr:hypothetical protein [Bacteroidales bacterium]
MFLILRPRGHQRVRLLGLQGAGRHQGKADQDTPERPPVLSENFYHDKLAGWPKIVNKTTA